MVFTGVIDKYPVTFHLYRINDEFSGTYYYNSTEEPIDISGKMDNNRFLKLTHYSEESDASEALEGVFKDSSFAGTWMLKGKMLPFRLTQKKDNSNLAFDYIWTKGSKNVKKVHDYDPDELSYEATAVWPTTTSQHRATNLIRQVIREQFGDTNSLEEIGKIMIRHKNEILNPVKKEDDVEVAESGTTVQVQYQNAQLLTLCTGSFSYTAGAAHGYYGTNYTCIDLINNRKLEITDVLDTLAGRKILQALLEKKFRATHNLKKEEKLTDYLFEDTISPGDDFSLTTKGIGFNYNPYEIGPYVLGTVYLYIPFKEIDAYLKPAFKKLIGR